MSLRTSIQSKTSAFIKRCRQFVKKVASHDPSSWGSHWVICVFISLLVAFFFGKWGGLITSEILLIYFAMRETSNWITHKNNLDMPSKYQKDGILDFTGPLVNHLLWWIGFLL